MKSITIQASQVKGKNTFQLSVNSNEQIVKAFFVKITEEDIKDITEMMED